MSKKKNFKIKDIKQLIEPMGGCIATDRITVDGLTVGYMYRGEPNNDLDSGWHFFGGDESQDYIDDLNNSSVYDVNTIANYDQSIIPYLEFPIGVELEKNHKTGVFDLIAQ